MAESRTWSAGITAEEWKEYRDRYEAFVIDFATGSERWEFTRNAKCDLCGAPCPGLPVEAANTAWSLCPGCVVGKDVDRTVRRKLENAAHPEEGTAEFAFASMRAAVEKIQERSRALRGPVRREKPPAGVGGEDLRREAEKRLQEAREGRAK